MFREMRRNGQELPLEECTAILNRGTSGVLALSGDDNYPYAVPVSYAYDGYKLYFHCAKSGHKIDAIRRNAKASFCVIDQDLVVPEEYTSYFRSIIAFGTIRILEDSQESGRLSKSSRSNMRQMTMMPTVRRPLTGIGFLYVCWK